MMNNILNCYPTNGWSDTEVIFISNKEMNNYVKSTFNVSKLRKGKENVN